MLLLTACSAAGQDKGTINPDEFEKAIREKGVQVLDVRRPDEYKEGHLAGAVNADWHDDKVFQEQAALLDKKKPVYVYCLSGGRSAKATGWLKDNGFATVIGLEGGIKAWKAASKPLQTDH